MTDIVIIIAVVGIVTFGIGQLSGHPWITAAAMVALSLPLWFLNSPLGPIGPAMMILCWIGAVVGAGVVELLRQRSA